MTDWLPATVTWNDIDNDVVLYDQRLQRLGLVPLEMNVASANAL